MKKKISKLEFTIKHGDSKFDWKVARTYFSIVDVDLQN